MCVDLKLGVLTLSCCPWFCYNIATTPCSLRLCSAGCLEIPPLVLPLSIVSSSILSDVGRKLPRHRRRRCSVARTFDLPSAVNTTRTSSLSSRVFISHNKRHTRKYRCQSLCDVSASDDDHPNEAAAAAAAAAFSCFYFRWEHDSQSRLEPDDSSFWCFPSETPLLIQ